MSCKENIEAVIHADTGAETAKREYSMGERVCSAIKKHTVGAENMSITDKIIYIADACEETRRYPGAAQMRELAMEDIDAAVIMNMEQTIKRLEKQGIASLINEKEGKKCYE